MQMLFEQHERENDDGKVCPQHNHAPILDDSRRRLAGKVFRFSFFVACSLYEKGFLECELREEKKPLNKRPA